MRGSPLARSSMRFLAALLACSLVAACGLVYKIDVQQGNYLTEDAVAKLKVGMTRTEARQVLGTPLLADAFHANRWDYYFSNVKGGRAEDRKRFSVFFENDKVVSFNGSAQPAAPPPVAPPAPTPGAPAPR
jgi:outer membrane protein assembly factor BamE